MVERNPSLWLLCTGGGAREGVSWRKGRLRRCHVVIATGVKPDRGRGLGMEDRGQPGTYQRVKRWNCWNLVAPVRMRAGDLEEGEVKPEAHIWVWRLRIEFPVSLGCGGA